MSYSETYIVTARPICLQLFRQADWPAFAFALAKAGNSSPASIAIMAITTSNSISVKPLAKGLVNRGDSVWGSIFMGKRSHSD